MTHIIPSSSSENDDFTTLHVEDFWDRHGKAVIAGGIVLVIAGIIAFIVLAMQHNRELAAQAAFAAAADEATLQAVIQNYPQSPSALNAALLLSQLQRNNGKYEEASATLQAAIAKFPDEALTPLASLGLAANAAAAGQAKQYSDALQQTAARYSSSFVAPYALLSEAECSIAQGKNAEAVTILRNLAAQYPESVVTRSSAGYVERLESLADTDAKN